AGGLSEYTRLSVARQICEPAAYESASWGAFQIMGFHWQMLGYKSVQEMVADASRSEGAQLGQFVRFILADDALHKALKARKWSAFARIYNGPAYADNLYDVKLARAYKRYAEPVEVAA
ncbi:MAG: N-acetylmuramidase family protein, partial [Alcaligenaceae bacterium]|nr:N-acetylmuramidase family protein [Alcaligenaceae bacterium]